ncbi:hypothetical protein JCM10450v2_004293 [Rhodotorula kratochvilovae]
MGDALPRFGDGRGVLDTLKAIQRIPREAFKREQSRRAAEDDERRRMLAQLETRFAQIQRTTPTAQVPRPAPTPQAQAQRTNTQLPNIPAKTGSGPYFAEFKMQRGLSKEQAQPLSFAKDAAGQAQYDKALALFKRTHPAHAARTTPITASFPLAPGTLPLGGRSCDKCGVASDHIAMHCSNTPLSEDERMYRRAWRWVASRRTGPTWGTSGATSVNLIGDIDSHMASHASQIYIDDEPIPSVSPLLLEQGNDLE